jgi:hypothetical protein
MKVWPTIEERCRMVVEVHSGNSFIWLVCGVKGDSYLGDGWGAVGIASPGVQTKELVRTTVSDPTNPNHRFIAGVAGIATGLGNVAGVIGFCDAGDGVVGFSKSAQHSAVSGVNDSGGFGVWARAGSGTAIFGQGSTGVIGLAAGTSEPGHGPTGVIGRTNSGSDSGV